MLNKIKLDPIFLTFFVMISILLFFLQNVLNNFVTYDALYFAKTSINTLGECDTLLNVETFFYRQLFCRLFWVSKSFKTIQNFQYLLFVLSSFFGLLIFYIILNIKKRYISLFYLFPLLISPRILLNTVMTERDIVYGWIIFSHTLVTIALLERIKKYEVLLSFLSISLSLAGALVRTEGLIYFIFSMLLLNFINKENKWKISSMTLLGFLFFLFIKRAVFA